MASNPRIDDLRKRIDREPGSRLFAQLAEELRKDGELDEAIRVCREGLSRHPAYPSARMTLGRALQDKGDLREARQEFEAVLKGAPDNILAGRLLAECLEGLGEADAALGRYQATLALAPGDRAILAGLERLRGHAGAAGPPSGVGATAPPVPVVMPRSASPVTTGPARPAGLTAAGRLGAPTADSAQPPAPEAAVGPSGPAAEPPPIPVADIDEPMVLERSDERAQTLYPDAPHAEPAAGEPREPPPIPISAVEEESFELEAAYEAPVRGDFPAEAGPPAAGVGAVEAEAAGEFDFDLESSSTAPVPAVRLEPAAEAETPWLERGLAPEGEDPPVTSETGSAHAGGALDSGEAGRQTPELPEPSVPAAGAGVPGIQDPAANGAASAAVPAGERPPEIASTTLAELYFAQGLREKAADVYREILRREPDNARARQRLGEIEVLVVGGGATAAPAGFAPGSGGREAALQRTIARLEAFLEVVRRPRA